MTRKYRLERDVSASGFGRLQASQAGLLSGNADGSLRRAAELCQGWLPAKLGPDQIRQKRAVLDGYARAAGRDPAQAQAAFSAALYGYLAHAEETTTSR